MRVGVPKETYSGEKRVALTPVGVKKLLALGFSVQGEARLGIAAGFTDDDYRTAGADIVQTASQLLADSQIILRVRKPDIDTVASLAEGSLHISFLDPFNETTLVQTLAEKGVSSISMEMIPRTTTAQRMDALSSQANLAGYAAVITAASHLPKILPMMMTPAGTLSPSRVFIIGAGVAGLQAIATAKRLGARVEAFDTRPVVAEQVSSLGAKFVEIDLGGEAGQTGQGYAKALTEEQLAMQKAGMKKVISASDIVITTAQVFGRPAPRIVTKGMVASMAAGSVVVDMAVETGGNVEGSKPDSIVNVEGVTVIGQGNLPSSVAKNASEMFSANLVHLLGELWDKESENLQLDGENELVKACLITQGGAVVHAAIANK